MKKALTKGISFALSLAMIICASPVFSIAENSWNGYYYRILDDGTAMITDYDGDETELIIPEEIDGYTLTTIGGRAFTECTTIESVTVPDGVTSIGGSAFYRCEALVSVTLPDSVTSIGASAFGSTAYYNDSSNWEDGVLYIGNHLISAKSGLSGEYAVKDGTVCIADSAFSGCISLTSVEIPESVKTIGNEAFFYCVSLESAVISGCEIIADSAFNHCTSLCDVQLPYELTSVGNYAFYRCVNLQSIYMHENTEYIGEYAFAFCKSLVNMAIPENIKAVNEYSFAYCDDLKVISIPESVVYIASGAFDGCTALCDVYYDGDADEWSGVTVGNNVRLAGANMYYKEEVLFYPILEDIIPLPDVVSSPVIQMSATEGSVGETVAVTVDGKNIKGLESSDLEFTYDPEYLEYVNVYSDDYDIAMWAGGNPATGTVTYSFVWLNEAKIDQSLCTIIFRVIKGGYSAVSCSLNSWDGTDTPAESSVIVESESGCEHLNTVYYYETPASCDECGYTAGTYCEDCGRWTAGHYEIPAPGHTDSNGDSVCDVCGEAMRAEPYIDVVTQRDGDVLTATVYGMNIKRAQSFDLEFYFDSSVLAYSGIEANDVFGSNRWAGGSPYDGTVTFSAYWYNSCDDDNLDICVITFKVLSDENTSLGFGVNSWEGTQQPAEASFNITLSEPVSEEPATQEPMRAEPYIDVVTQRDGDVLTATVYGMNIKRAQSFDLEFYFDSSVLAYSGIEANDVFGSNRWAGGSPYDGTVTFSAVWLDSCDDDNLDICVITFKVLSDEDTSLGFGVNSWDGTQQPAEASFNITLSEPVSEEPVSGEPATENPAPQAPSDGESPTQEPTTEETSAYEPVSEEPTAPEPVYEKPNLSMSSEISDGKLTVTARGENMRGVESFDLEFGFDPSVLEYVSVKKGSGVDYDLYEGGNPDESSVTFSACWRYSCNSDDIDICYMTFNIISYEDTSIKSDVKTWDGSQAPEDVILDIAIEEYTELNEPASEEPMSEELTTEEPTAAEPESEEPTTEEPTTEEPVSEEPTTEEPVSQEPTTEEPTTEEPASQEPISAEPTTEEPTTEKITKVEPTTKEPVTSITVKDGGRVSADDENKFVTITADNNKSLTAAELLASLGNENVRIIDKNGTELGGNALVGTGARVQLLGDSSETLSEYEVIVPSDVNGDGKTTAADARNALRASAKLDNITGVYSIAADMTEDKKITASDARKILRRSAGLEK